MQLLSLQKRICVSRQKDPSKVKVSTGTSKMASIAQTSIRVQSSLSRLLHSRKMLFCNNFVCSTFICRKKTWGFSFRHPVWWAVSTGVVRKLLRDSMAKGSTTNNWHRPQRQSNSIYLRQLRWSRIWKGIVNAPDHSWMIGEIEHGPSSTATRWTIIGLYEKYKLISRVCLAQSESGGCRYSRL